MRHFDGIREWISGLADTDITTFFDHTNNLEILAGSLRRLAEDEEHWHELVPHAVVDNNGFTKIRLARTTPEKPDLRLHVWSGGNSGNYHNHPWNFSSLVLHGVIRHELFSPVDGEDYCEYHYESIRPGEFSSFIKGRKSLKLIVAVNTIRGSVIFYDHRTVHGATARTSRALSLMIRGSMLKSHSDIYLPPAAPGVPRNKEAHPDAAELGGYIRLAADGLAAIVSNC